MVCKVADCDREVYAIGLCKMHRSRLKKTGTTDEGSRARGSLHKRIWSKIQKADPHECWLWTGKSLAKGYGQVNRGRRGEGMVLAHRFVWEEFNGTIPSDGSWHGKVVLHLCDNRRCCNPAHLSLGSQTDNIHDMDSKGRRVITNFGEANVNAKLNAELVRAIRASTGTHKEVANQFGVSLSTICAVRHRKAWKHVA